uniref:Ig-like domain-containing protein n=1 Tax=Xiphophorus maculatus TaxID=8083 RepID=A0A3B5R104_XIPMA
MLMLMFMSMIEYEFSSEGSSVTLTCSYSKAAVYNDYIFWYRQYPGKPPDFLISHSGTGAPISTPLPGFSFDVNADKTQMDLLISSAAVTDSAVYYCGASSGQHAHWSRCWL